MKYVIREYLYSEQNTHLVKFIPSHSNLPLQPQPLPQFESPQPSLAIVNSQQPSNLVRARPNILPVVQENDFLPPISLWTQLGGLFLASTVGIAIALAAVTPYKVTVQAQANIRPAGELRLVEAETEGSVVDIRVKENQTVKKGDILAIIDNSRLETRKSQLESNIEQANLQLKQIQAQITSQNHRISAEADRLNRTIASAEAELSRRLREYQDRLITTSAEVTESEANLKSIQAALNAAISKRNRYQIVAHAGALSKNQLEEAQVAVEQQEQAVQAAQARLQSVQTALNPSNAEVAKARENIAQEKAIGQSNLANLQREKEALIQQQIEIQQQQSRDQHELQQLEKDLDQTAIKATADGILFQLNLRNTGQRVVSGEEIAQIAPINTPLLVKASVSAQNISQVKPGQLAQLRVSACPYPDYGIIQGVVNKISPDTIQFPGQNNTAVASATTQTKIQPGETALYQVTIEPESLTLGHGNNRCSLQLGMEGRVDIIANEETVLKFLLRKARLLTDL